MRLRIPANGDQICERNDYLIIIGHVAHAAFDPRCADERKIDIEDTGGAMVFRETTEVGIGGAILAMFKSQAPRPCVEARRVREEACNVSPRTATRGKPLTRDVQLAPPFVL